jgi:hypothetical protein
MRRDRSAGKSELDRMYWWRCVACLHMAMYEPDQIERYQHLSWKKVR